MRVRLVAAVSGVLVVAGAIVAVILVTAGGNAQPQEDPGVFASRVVTLITHNRYGEAWSSLHPADRGVATRSEYVSCEERAPFKQRVHRVKVVGVSDESVGLGNGRFVDSKAVVVRITLSEPAVPSRFDVTHTVHVVSSNGRWTWILPPWRFADFRANRCADAPQADSSAS